jgi:hypothetical protein
MSFFAARQLDSELIIRILPGPEQIYKFRLIGYVNKLRTAILCAVFFAIFEGDGDDQH